MCPIKPRANLAMSRLLGEIRTGLPFGLPESVLCQKSCVGCPKKLMAYIEQEIETWEMALAAGDIPTLGDVDRLAKTSRKIAAVMVKNGLIASE